MSQPSTGGIGARRPLAPPLSERDRAVVDLVARFRQLSAGQVHAALFADCASKTPCDRALKRLCERGYLARLTRPTGGDGGGSNQFVYQLGRAGWRLAGISAAYWAPRSVNLHTLAIADCFVALKHAEHTGELAVLRFETEPDCHRTVGTVELTPDTYAEVGIAARRLKFSLYLEVDRGTEKAEVIRGKCARYWQAYQGWPDEHFPYVVFVVPDAQRRSEIARIVKGGPESAHNLFRVFELSSLPGDIHRNLQ